MVNLPLGYRLEANENCIILAKPLGTFYIDKDSGKEYENKKNVGYYSTIPQALDGWWRATSRELIGAPGEIELKELLAAIKALSDEATRAIGSTKFVDASRSPAAPSTAVKKPRTTKSKGTSENAL